jgi:hypothetical protein
VGERERTTRGNVKSNSVFDGEAYYLNDAMEDLLVWKDANDSVDIALGLPEFVTYRNEIRTLAIQLEGLTASVIWVFEDEKVKVFPHFL